MTNRKFSLSKEEKLKSRKLLEQLYKSGQRVSSGNKKVRALFLKGVKQGDGAQVKIAVAVSKKTGNAVVRNRIKRLLRESYRLNKFVLIDEIKDSDISLSIVFTPLALSLNDKTELRLNVFEPEVCDILKKILSKILRDQL
ncbi:MAG: ribonuclease P protein component [Ignavibacteriaceae bacterium]|nr:ribonuclease P protein component [Ignavibacteriaceae bacterium]